MATASDPRVSRLPAGQFRFEYVGGAPIGAGGLGRVYRVRIVASNAAGVPEGSEWAVKVLNERWNRHPVMRARFEREIAALQRMFHPNIVTLHGENLPGGERFYVMPLFSTSVRRFIAQGGHCGDWRAVARLGVVLAEALLYAHGRGFVHRDLKPDNILFNPGGPLVIADWGLGYFVHKESVVLQHLTRGGMGTEYYCSPEQWATGKCDQRGDVYSLGMTLDEWVTGRQRPIAIGMGLDHDTVRDPSQGARRFNLLLRAMTKPNKAERPWSMQDVAAGLHAAAEGR